MSNDIGVPYMETIELFSNLTPPWFCRFRVPLPYVGPLLNMWCRYMAGEKTMTEIVYLNL
jgi:hypothetical protein